MTRGILKVFRSLSRPRDDELENEHGATRSRSRLFPGLRYRSRSHNDSERPLQLEKKPADPTRELPADILSRLHATSVTDVPPEHRANTIRTDSCEQPPIHNTDTTETISIGHETENNVATRDLTSRVFSPDASLSNATDIWSAAYHEAVAIHVKKLGAIPEGQSIQQLFEQLEKTDNEARDSLFRRGLEHLARIKGPMEKLKMVLDVASPLTSIEPTASTVLLVVKSVTALAVSLSSATESFTTQISSMLEQIDVIDRCDTWGQKLDHGRMIHNALVNVYGDLLQFYDVAYRLLQKSGVKLVLHLVVDDQRLPSIVNDFLKRADTLQDRIQLATSSVIQDIRNMLWENRSRQWLGMRRDKDQYLFHERLKDIRADDACTWLLKNAEFVHWYNEPTSTQLSIIGAMGYGKTVMAAYIVDTIICRNENRLPRAIICYHYCHDDETGRALNVYSSLILQLLTQQPGLKKMFVEWYEERSRSGRDPASSVESLQSFLEDTVLLLDRVLFVVLDGLDECDKESRDRVMEFLDDLSRKTPRLKVLFSSRPQTDIVEMFAKKGHIRQVHLKPDRARDNIIVEHTVSKSLANLDANSQGLIIHTLSDQAEGSAIWIKLVVQQIEKRRLGALGSIRRYLQSTPQPSQLSELYTKLFRQAAENEPSNIALMTKALEFLSVARRSLSINELAWVVTIGVAQDDFCNISALAEHVDQSRVISLLQPFLAPYESGDLEKNQIRLVHQSLKELIVRESPSAWCSSPQEDESPSKSLQSRSATLEHAVFDICAKYLLLREIDTADLSSLFLEKEELTELGGLAQLYNEDNGSSPCSTSGGDDKELVPFSPADGGFGEFFVYASCYWVEHYGAIPAPSPFQLQQVTQLCCAGSARLRNWMDQYCRPDCGILPKFAFDAGEHDPLSLTALYSSERALRALLDFSELNGVCFLRESVSNAAWRLLKVGDVSRLQILFLHPRTSQQVCSFAFFREALGLWTITKGSQHWESVFDLVRYGFDAMLAHDWANEILCKAARVGCVGFAKRLFAGASSRPQLRNRLLADIQRDADLHRTSRHWQFHQSIGEAVLGNSIDVVRFLLDQPGIEPHLQHRNSRGYNVLHLAAKFCHAPMLEILVSRFPGGVNEPNAGGDTPIMCVIHEPLNAPGRLESASILIHLGNADVNIPLGDSDAQWYQPLRMAARRGDLDMCRILVEEGQADPRSPLKAIKEGHWILKDAMSENLEMAFTVVELLITLSRKKSP